MERWKREELTRLSSIFMGGPNKWRKAVEGMIVQVIEDVEVEETAEDGTKSVKTEKRPVLHSGMPTYKVQRVDADDLLKTLSEIEMNMIMRQHEAEAKAKEEATAAEAAPSSEQPQETLPNGETGSEAVSSDSVQQG
jgi:hypothetical protein